MTGITADKAPIRPPRSGLELLKWLIFEPLLFKKYGISLDRKQTVKAFLKAYLWIVLFSIILWLAVNLVISIFDLPSLFPGQFRKEIVEGWNNYNGWWDRFFFYSAYTFFSLFIYLVFGLAIGLARVLAKGLAFRLTIGLAIGLAAGLVGRLAFRLTLGLALGLIVGLALGLASESIFKLTFKLVFKLVYGLVFGLVTGLVMGLLGWLAIGLAGIGTGSMNYFFLIGLSSMIVFYIFYFRMVPFYPVHVIRSIYRCTLALNPFRSDGMIWLPIPGVKKKLLEEAWQKPREAFEFIDFLLTYRPLQKNLAMHLVHKATAATWRQHQFQAEILKEIPLISKDRPKFQPSQDWLEKLN